MKTSNKNKFQFSFMGLCTILSLFIFSNCEIGLGKTIDTERPTISITSPAPKSALMGDFKITGNASDETSVKSVSLIFKNINTSAVFGPYVANLDSSGAWVLSVSASSVPDGDYNITATAVDSADRTQIADIVYTIDNHAPTVLLTSPASYSKANPPKFFKQIDIKGEVYDATTLTQVEVFIADGNGVTIAKKIAEGTNTFLASFELSELTGLSEDGIYYYYAIATDTAGNKSSYCYHRSDIFKLLAEVSNSDGSSAQISFPSINAIGSLDEGRVVSLDNGLTATNLFAKKQQNTFVIGTAPEDPIHPNLKYFKTESQKIEWLNLDSSDASSSIGIGVPIVGSILPPADGSAILDETIEVWVVKAGADGNFPTFSDANKLVVGTSNAQVIITSVGSSKNFEISSHKFGDNNDWGSGTWKVKIQYSTDSRSGGNDTCSFIVSSGAPKLTETGFANNGTETGGTYYRGYINAPGHRFSGISKTSDGSAKASLTLLREGLSDVTVTVNDDGTYSHSIVVNSVTHENDGEYTYTLRASSGTLTTTLSRVVVIDTQVPVVSLTNLVNNGVINKESATLTGTAIDSFGIKKLEYKLLKGSEVVNDWTVFGNAKSAFDLPLAGLAEGFPYKIYLRATDAAGNISGDESSVYNFVVDLDVPIATIDTITTNATPPVSLSPTASMIYASNTVTFTGKAHDDKKTVNNPAKTAVLTYSKDRGAVTTITAGVGENEFKWNKEAGTWSWKMPNTFDSGLYDITLTVTDAGNNTAIAKSTMTLDKAAPVINIESISPYVDTDVDGKYKVNGTIIVKGTTTDNDKIVSVNYGWNGATPTTVGGNFNVWTITLDTTNVSGTKLLSDVLNFEATDQAGHKTTTTTGYDLSNFTIDQVSDKPSIKCLNADTSKTTQDSVGVKETDSINLFDTTANNKLNFILNDDDGIKTVVVKIDDTEKAELGKTYDVPLSSLNYNFSIASLTEGFHRVEVIVKDKNWTTDANTNNQNTTGVFYIVVDNNAPILMISEPNTGAWVKTPLTVKGTVSDTNTSSNPVLNVWFSTSDTSTGLSTDSGYIAGTGTYSATWEYTITGIASNGYVYARAKDASGKISTQKVEVSFDSGVPVLTVDSPEDKYYIDANSPTKRFTGKLVNTGGSGVDQVRYVISDSATPPVFSATTGIQATGNAGTWVILADFTSNAAGATNRAFLHIAGCNGAGNWSAVKTLETYIDKSNPTMALQTAAGGVYKDSFTIKATISDDIGLADANPVTAIINDDVTTLTPVKSTNGSDIANTWLIEVPNTITEGSSHEITITARDKGGKQSQLKFPFTFDKTAPTVKFNSIADDGSTKIIENTPKIYGSISDTHSKLKSVTVQFLKADSTGITFTAPTGHNALSLPGFTANSSLSQSFTLDLVSILGDKLTDGLWKVKFIATDQIDNQLTVESNKFIVDRSDPDVSVGNLTLTGSATVVQTYVSQGKAYSIVGTASDIGGLETVNIVIKLNNTIVKIDGKDSKAATVDSINRTWTCDLGSVFNQNGEFSIYAIATDKAGRVKETSKSFICDIDKPNIVFVTPFAKGSAQSSTLIGKVNFSGRSEDGAMRITSYAVGGTIDATNDRVNYTDGSTADFTAITNSTYNWSAEVDTSAYAGEKFATKVPGKDTVWSLPFHIKAEDLSGNITYDTLTITIDTDADKPTVSFSSPENNATVGGQFNISGVAEDRINGTVNKVFMQVEVIGAEYGPETEGTDGTYKTLPKFVGMTFDSGKNEKGDADTKYFTKVGTAKEAWYEITGKTSWNFSLNTDAEFNKEDLVAKGVTFDASESARLNNASTTRLIIRVKAQDTKDAGVSPGVAGYSKAIEVLLQSGAPSIIENNIPDAGTYVSGTVPLNFTVKDDAGISNVVIKIGADSKTISSGQVSATSTVIEGFNVIGSEPQSTYFKTWTITGTLDTTTLAKQTSLVIQATDNTSPTPNVSVNQRTLFIDNTPPVLEAASTGSANILSTDVFAGTKSLQSGKAADSESGTKMVILYFTNKANNKIFSMGGTATDGTGIDTAGSAISTKTISGKNIPFPENSLADIKTIKTGGIAQKYIVVDRAEGAIDNGDNGDKDGYAEQFATDGSWYVRVNSENIPDGEYNLHYVAVDRAGNIVHTSNPVSIKNHAPKITSLKLFTDLNINGSIENSEFTEITPVPILKEDLASGFTSIERYEDMTTDFVVRNNKLKITITADVRNGIATYDLTPPVVATDTFTTATNSFNFTGFSPDSGAFDKTFTIKVKDAINLSSAPFAFKVKYQNTDTEVPKSWFYELNTDVASGDKVNTGSISLSGAHIEPRDASLYDNTTTNDPDVSGTVVLRGRVTDNQRLTSVSLVLDGVTTQILNWDVTNNALKPVVPAAKIISQNLSLTGHDIEWSYEWDTSSIVNTAKNNVTIKVIATDAASRASTDTTYSNSSIIPAEKTVASYNVMTVDVVPYITDITTSLSKHKKNNPSVYNRTALGHYPVNATETISVVGYNLKNASVFGNASNITSTTVDATTKAVTLGIPMSSASTGKINLSVNSIPLLNNENDNTKAWNKKSNNDNNLNLTDDVVLDVWQFNERAAITAGSGTINEPIMKINPANGIIGFAFSNGPRLSSMPNAGNSYQQWQGNFARQTGISLAYDESGISHATFVGLDTNPGESPAAGGRMTYSTSKWGSVNANMLGNMGNYDGYAASRIESIGVYESNTSSEFYGGGHGVIMEDRFPSISIVATTKNRTNPTIYLAYYDDLRKQIRFRYGTNDQGQNRGVTFGQFADQTAPRNGLATDAHRIFDAHTDYYSVVASEANATYKSGQYVDIAVKPGATLADDVVVMTYFDATNNSWMYTYKVNPANDNDLGSGTGNGYWATPITIMEEAGEHCKIAIENDGRVHIAAYDGTNLSLVYAYLPSYNSPSTAIQKCTVDAYGIVGTNISIDVAKSANGNSIPYISYYTPSVQKAKIAYLVEPKTGLIADNAHAPAGVDSNESFTGDWEVTTIPNTSQKVSQDHISVGVWKTPAGAIKNSVTGISSSGANNGACYGNGTANPVIAYATRVGTAGYIETAQKK